MDEEQQPVISGNSNVPKIAGIVLAVAYVLGSGYFIYDLNSRVGKVDEAQRAVVQSAELRNKAVMEELGITEASLKQTEAAQSRLSKTQRALAARAAALHKQEEETSAQLEQSQHQLASMSDDLGGVKTGLNGARGDISSTRSDLEATKKKLDSTIGDLGMQSGLIAHTRDDLEVLKHKGDRNIYEFTLTKSKHPTPVGTVSLQLKKVDSKKGTFTMNVLADDRTIEKKNRNVAEPLQFYSGRDRMLYEVVVFAADKKSVTGYLSTPKNAPQPGVINQ
jgi:multidrug efflux pump subunit AcrA (membrane-fusion protein)